MSSPHERPRRAERYVVVIGAAMALGCQDPTSTPSQADPSTIDTDLFKVGTARMVILPHEAHGYRARESVLHTLHESFRWFDMYVKNPQPSTQKAASK